MIVYDTALRRAHGAIRRGLKQDAAHWMKVADHANRLGYGDSITREKHTRALAKIWGKN